MSEYSSLTVAQLKEKLKEKGLATDGKKADLVQRLTEASADEPTDEPKGELDETMNELDEPEEKDPEPKKEEDPEKPKEEPKEPKEEPKPEKKKLSPEELKKMAVEVLTTKIKRAEKFGDEALAQTARENLARVEKFGLDPSTALAKEIGLVDRGFSLELGVQKSREGRKKGGKKNKKKAQKTQQ